MPSIGGAGVVAEVRAARRDEHGEFVELVPTSGSLFQIFSIPTHTCQPVIPPEANVIARRVPIPLFGAGLVEAIPDEALLALDDGGDRDRDGISGRAAIITDIATGQRRVGRFGWKAQQATLLAFAADAYRNEMGITNDLFPDELAFGITPEQMKLCDRIPDPEDQPDRRTRRRGIDNFEAFMKFLAPAGRGPIDDTVRAGEALFATVGCASCHVPSLQTGPEREPGVQSQGRAALFGSAAARHRDRRRHPAGGGHAAGVQDAGAVGAAAAPAAAARRHGRRRSKTPSAVTPARPRPRANGFAALPADQRAALLAFLKSLLRHLADFRPRDFKTCVTTVHCSTSSFDAARAPIVIRRPSLPRSITESAAASRLSTSTGCPGFRSLLSMKRRNAGS